MKRKAVSGIMLTLLLVSMSTLAFNIQLVKADWTWTETIYIRADGSVDPDTAPISSVDNITYTLTDNIAGDVPRGSSAIVVERNNIIVDGASYTVQGTGMHAWGSGINLTYSNNVTIRNVQVTNFRTGIELHNSGNSLLSGNVASNNTFIGIHLYDSSNNTLFHNNLIDNAVNVTTGYANTWDNGYPSGGNYWSDYSGVDADGDGIGDTPYVIDANNQDNYPLIEPWSPPTMTKTLIRTVKFWNLSKGTENSLISKLEGALHSLDTGKKNQAIHRLMAFTNQVEALQGKKLTNVQADYLIAEAQRIIDLING